MPVITLYQDRFSKFLECPLPLEELVKLLPWIGLDIEETGENYVRVEFNPNRIDFSSYTGIAKAVELIAAQYMGTDILKASMSPTLIIGALLFSFFVGALSGIAPSYRASKLHPVEALRYE